LYFFFSSRRRHTRFKCDWSSDVCSSDLADPPPPEGRVPALRPKRRGVDRELPVEVQDRDVGGRPRRQRAAGEAEEAGGADRHARSEERRVGKEGRVGWMAAGGGRERREE